MCSTLLAVRNIRMSFFNSLFTALGKSATGREKARCSECIESCRRREPCIATCSETIYMKFIPPLFFFFFCLPDPLFVSSLFSSLSLSLFFSFFFFYFRRSFLKNRENNSSTFFHFQLLSLSRIRIKKKRKKERRRISRK